MALTLAIPSPSLIIKIQFLRMFLVECDLWSVGEVDLKRFLMPMRLRSDIRKN